MKKLLMVVPLVILLCFTFGCQQGEEVAEEEKAVQEEPKEVMALAQERQAIAETNIKFGEVFSSGDAAALASLYTEDAWLISQTGDMFKGREGVEAFWAGAFQMGMKEVVLTTVDVMRMDDMVGEFGKADLTIKPEGQDEIKDVGKYLVIWKKAADGTWKLYADIMF
ncbi:hypothetical protein LCGC14_0669500 [marine sediment metagenome]|uniref:DUF4440 domain-containing protein n=1 Tax=marine sediment metagenome TaxID=412755 RepID=A0A0F9QRD1_9ZZZZ|nr:SgcJ/EcaC family oxidoreductase [Candidatus Aminicenantes bacterium]HEB36020.1 SgcJ/EcaC family oxidoreductase [Candidatus Aminicenantes bacterium]